MLGEQFVQGGAGARAEDFGKAEGGEAEQARALRVGGEGGGEIGREGGAGVGFHAGEIDQDGAAEIAQADLAGEFGDHSAVEAGMGVVLGGAE